MLTTQLLRLAISSNSRIATARIASVSPCSSSASVSSSSSISPSSSSPLSSLSSASAASQWWRRSKQLPVLGPAPMAMMKVTGVGAGAGVFPRGSCRIVKREFSVSARMASGGEHSDETYEEFTIRYEKEFEAVNDVFDLQRNLNNAFAYDLVPAPSVIVAALRAARRVNDFPTAVRIFEGIQAKVENKMQYEEYVKELEPLREELGVPLKESLYPNLP